MFDTLQQLVYTALYRDPEMNVFNVKSEPVNP